MNAMKLERLKQWAQAVKLDIFALYLAARDPRVPWYAKVMAGMLAAYALSPIDLIPDFVPILGYLDDVIILPLGIIIVVRLIPVEVMDDLRRQAAENISTRPRATAGTVFIVIVWLVALVLLVLAIANRWIE